MSGAFVLSDGFVRVIAGALNSGLIRVVNGVGQGSIAGLPVYVTNGRNVSVQGLPAGALPVTCEVTLDQPQTAEHCVVSATDGLTDTRCAVQVNDNSLVQVPKASETASASVPVSAVSKIEVTLVAPYDESIQITGDPAIGQMGKPYTTTFTAVGFNGSQSLWSASGLPAGLSISNGVVSGTTEVSGLFPVTISATDSYGRVVSKTTYLRVNYSTDAVITRQASANGFLHFDGSDNTYPFLQYYTGTIATNASMFASAADGSVLALMVMASGGGRAQAWRRVGGGFVNDLTIDSLPTLLYSLDLSRDGVYLALGENSAASGDKLRIMKRVSNNFAQVASAVADGSIYSDAMKWHPSGGYIAVSSTSGGGKIFKFQADALTVLTGVTFAASDSISWSPNGQYLAVSGSGGLRVYTFQGELLTLLATGSDSGGQHVWSPDNRFIYSVGSTTNRLQVFELVGAALVTLPLPVQPPDYANLNCSISPSGKQLIVGYGSGSGKNNTTTTGTGLGDGVSVYDVSGGTLTLSATETIAFDGTGNYRAVHYLGGR